MRIQKKYLLIAMVLAAIVGIAVSGKWNLLTYGLILLCPLMHMFGHNHSGHGKHSDHK